MGYAKQYEEKGDKKNKAMEEEKPKAEINEKLPFSWASESASCRNRKNELIEIYPLEVKNENGSSES